MAFGMPMIRTLELSHSDKTLTVSCFVDNEKAKQLHISCPDIPRIIGTLDGINDYLSRSFELRNEYWALCIKAYDAQNIQNIKARIRQLINVQDKLYDLLHDRSNAHCVWNFVLYEHDLTPSQLLDIGPSLLRFRYLLSLPIIFATYNTLAAEEISQWDSQHLALMAIGRSAGMSSDPYTLAYWDMLPM